MVVFGSTMLRQRTRRRSWASWLGAGLLLPLALGAGSMGRALGQASVSASVDKGEFALDDQVTLTITVQGSQDVGQPVLSGLSDFSVLSQSSSQSIGMTGGGMSVNLVFEYVLQARSEGTKTIPPIEVRVGRRKLKTQPVIVKVLPAQNGPSTPSAGSSAPPGVAPFQPPGEAEGDVIVRCDVDQKRAYVGQQIVLTFSVLYSGALQSLQYQPPKTEGFRTQELPAPPARYETVNGRQYIVRQDLRALFPTAPGQLTVGPATVQYTRGYFEPLPGTASTKPITVEVLRLPEASKPDGFSGVVGQLDVRAALDRTTIKRGEAATLTAVVSGWGNLDAMKAPVIPLPAGLRQYNSTENRELGPQPYDGSYRVQGKVLFDTVIVPTTVGDLTLPAIEVGYFDPRSGGYRVARSEPLVLHVQPGAVGETGEVVAGPTSQLKPLPNRLAGQGSTVLISAPIALAQLAALGWLVGAAVVRRRRSVLAANPRLARLRGAAGRTVKQVRAAAGRPAREAAARIAAAIAGYVGDKLDVPPATVSSASIEELLRETGVSAETAASAAALLHECDAARFAPAAADTPVAARAADLIRRLEGEMKHGAGRPGEAEAR